MEAILGFLIAVAVGMTGMGGGALAAPLLILYSGLPAAEAVGTSLVFVTVTKMLAAPIFVIRKQVHWPTVLRLLAGGLPGVAIGSWVLSRLSKQALEPLVLTLVGSTIVIIALVTLYRMIGKSAALAGTDRPKLLPAAALPIGMEVGFSSAGAGALGSLLLMNATSLGAATIVGTDMLFGWGVALAGGSLHIAFGDVNYAVVSKLLAGGALGALTGSWVAHLLPSRKLRLALTGFLVFLGGQMVFRAVSQGINFSSIAH